jgi:hypothetical protein
MSGVSSVIGNHPANYKGCTVYKDLQKNLSTPTAEAIHSPCTTAKKKVHAQPGITYAQITKQNISNTAPQDPARLTNQSQQPPSNTNDLQLLNKPFQKNLASLTASHINANCTICH